MILKHNFPQVVLTLTLVVLYGSASNSLHYYIVPFDGNFTDSECHDGTCLTLEQLALLNLTQDGETNNLTLFFMPGEHSLSNKSLVIQNFNYVQMNGRNSTALSLFGRSKIIMSNCIKVMVENLTFIHIENNISFTSLSELIDLDIRSTLAVHINGCSFTVFDSQEIEHTIVIGNAIIDNAPQENSILFLIDSILAFLGFENINNIVTGSVFAFDVKVEFPSLSSLIHLPSFNRVTLTFWNVESEVNVVIPTECSQGFSRVLGTNNCKKCSDIYLLLLIPFALLGLLLVSFILVFNITVATGTVYGLIFYANVIAANRDTSLEFPPIDSFLAVFISLVNLDFGIETCFYSQMSSQVQVLLQLIFPAYLFFLVFLIIILSRYLSCFSKLLSNRNPIAALSTLIFLSYSKLIRFIIDTLNLSNFTTQGYQNADDFFRFSAGHYSFSPGLICQLILAVIILIVGGLFALLLLFSQCFPRCSNWKLMKWTKNTIYTGFMDTFHAPFTPKHRYWVGLLLFGLIAHNIVVSITTKTFFPGVSAAFLSTGRLILSVLDVRIYKTWYNESMETLFFYNLLAFQAFYAINMWFRSFDQRERAANTSIAVTFLLFAILVCQHFYEYILAKTNTWQKLKVLMKSLKSRVASWNPRQIRTEASNERDITQMNLPRIDDCKDVFTTTKLDQLREPDLDELAPITADDYRPLPTQKPRVKQQKVTCTVIDL